jgi:DNA modification methylase
VWDVLEDDGTLWLNIGDSYAGSGKGRNADGTHQEGGKQGTNKGSIVGLLTKTETPNCKPKDLIGIPWMLAFALRADGWYLRQDIIWHKPNPMPESVQDRCTKAHEYIFLMSKSQKYHYDHEAIKDPVKQDWGTRDRTDGKYHNEGSGLQPHSGLEKSYEMANKRSVWTVNTKPYAGAHFAVFPSDLIEPCILAGAPAGGIVLDPFMGSGTTAQVAQNLGRQYLGCELNPEYELLQNKRLSQMSLELI